MKPTGEKPGRSSRRPLRNFVFNPAVQWPQIVRNGLLALFTSGGTGLSVLYIYHREFGGASIYLMDANQAFYPLDHQELFSLLLPAVLGPALAGVLLGWLLTLGASRRIALPVHKVGQWARRVSQGDLHVRLSFRREDGPAVAELAEVCNGAVDRFRGGIQELHGLAEDEKIPEEVRDRLGEIVARYKL
jgi:methyl-accepting chemotaxis protein